MKQGSIMSLLLLDSCRKEIKLDVQYIDGRLKMNRACWSVVPCLLAYDIMMLAECDCLSVQEDFREQWINFTVSEKEIKSECLKE